MRSRARVSRLDQVPDSRMDALMRSGAQTVRRKGPARPRQRRRSLVVAYSPDRSVVDRHFALSATPTVFGREASGEGLIIDPAMSRRHAAFSADASAVFAVEDLGSANGTFVDGARAQGLTPLETHQVVCLGETVLVVDGEPPRDHLPASADPDDEAAHEVIGRSLAAARIRASVDTVARAEGAVLLLGKTGVGKEVAAREVHRLSGRSGRFVAVNCAAIPRELAEAELFGHVPGAFTGATQARDGAFVESDGGTIFLDEIGELPEEQQAKLLRVLEQKEVRPVGSSETKKIDLRVVAATHQDLEGDDFRQDLFARLGDWVLRIPSLAERKADVLPLWAHFLDDPQLRRTSVEVAEALLLHDWPMNVRELAKLAQRIKSLTPEGEIALEQLPEAMQAPLIRRFDDSEEAPEPEQDLGDGAPPRAELQEALAKAKGNVKQVAIDNGWHRTQVYRWLRRARLDPKNYR